LAGAPFFLRRGGLAPLFVHFALLLKKKRNSRGIFQKKSVPAKAYSTTIPTEKYRYRLYLIPGKYQYRKNDWNHRGMQHYPIDSGVSTAIGKSTPVHVLLAYCVIN
jgi:hypothetical protein